MRMFDLEFNQFTNKTHEYYPEPLRVHIDELNAMIYENVNDGVYKAGFATSQSVYETAVCRLFETLDQLERSTVESTIPSRPSHHGNRLETLRDAHSIRCGLSWAFQV